MSNAEEPHRDLSKPRAIKCSARKTNGDPCGNYPLAGQRVCRFHGGATKAARAKAKERILAASDLAAKQLIQFMTSEKVPFATRLAAARDLLDRADVSGKTTVEVELPAWQTLVTSLDRSLGAPVAAPDSPAAIEPADVVDAELIEDGSDEQAPQPKPAVPALPSGMLTQVDAQDGRGAQARPGPTATRIVR